VQGLLVQLITDARAPATRCRALGLSPVLAPRAPGGIRLPPAAPGRRPKGDHPGAGGTRTDPAGQQPRHGVEIGLALGGINGAEAGVLQHALQAAGADAGCRQCGLIEQISLQPAQLSAIGTVQRLGALDGPGRNPALIPCLVAGVLGAQCAERSQAVALVPVRCGHGEELSSRAFKRRPVGGALAPVAAVTSSHKVCRSGVCGLTSRLSGAWQVRNGDHVWEKRCSGLDLLCCDPGSGYVAQD
jgi:hypothetical protein